MHLWIQHMIIRESRDYCLFDSYPRLFAAFHALHRLLSPRHPPHTLICLATMMNGSRFYPQPSLAYRRLKTSALANGGPLRTTALAVVTKYVQITLCRIVKELLAPPRHHKLLINRQLRVSRGTLRFVDRRTRRLRVAAWGR